MKIRHSEPYEGLRRGAYPPVTDQLDAIMKLAEALLAQGIVLPDEVQSWVKACRAVKDQFRKPSQ